MQTARHFFFFYRTQVYSFGYNSVNSYKVWVTTVFYPGFSPPRPQRLLPRSKNQQPYRNMAPGYQHVNNSCTLCLKLPKTSTAAHACHKSQRSPMNGPQDLDLRYTFQQSIDPLCCMDIATITPSTPFTAQPDFPTKHTNVGPWKEYYNYNLF